MRLSVMAQHRITLAALWSLSLGGCGQSETTVPTVAEPAKGVDTIPSALAPDAVPRAKPMAAASTASPSTPPAPSASRDPHVVAQAWADAVRACDWSAAYGYWGDHGARSGKTLAQFTTQWSQLKKPLIVLGKASQEGAAGSLYYTVPVTISDGDRRLSGELVLRRVNDVDGASAEQRRWHIDSTTLQP